MLTQDRTISRKVAEILLSLKVEQRLSKEELLEAYLNNVYWGHGVYGIAGMAAHFPFTSTATVLSLKPPLESCQRITPKELKLSSHGNEFMTLISQAVTGASVGP